ncbi:MAG: methyltransferase domain-containing protein [Chloroflexota bacterium]
MESIQQIPNNLAGFNLLRRDAWVAKIAKQLPPGMRLLDVGAGPCRYRTLFDHCSYHTQDFAQYDGKDIQNSQWRYGELDYICDATDIPVEDNYFDAVLCTEVLEHVPEPDRVLQEISRILKPNGLAFLSAPLGSGLHQQPFHFYGGFTPHFYSHFLQQHGLEILSIQPNGGFFRLLLQEIHRGLNLVARHYSPWHPTRLIFRLAASQFIARWLTSLDDQIPSPTHTVGYFVEARKKAPV